MAGSFEERKVWALYDLKLSRGKGGSQLQTELRYSDRGWTQAPRCSHHCATYSTSGDLNNDDGNSNENVKKVKGFVSKTTTYCLLHFLTVAATTT